MAKKDDVRDSEAPDQADAHGAGHAHGLSRRKALPRSGLGAWVAPADRADPVAVLQAQDADRLSDLVPLRYERMSASPFAFFRGAAAIMAQDLGSRPHTGLTVQLAGDAHLANFGGFATPDRTMVFDLNDFDETLPGPFEWDVQRLAASFEVAARHKGCTAKEQSELIGLLARTYRESVWKFAAMNRLDVWYARMSADDVLRDWAAGADAAALARIQRTLAKGRARTSSKAVSRYTHVGPDGDLRLVSRPPLLIPVSQLPQAGATTDIESIMATVHASYVDSLSPERQFLVRGYRPVDAGRKVVGVGSVGTRCWIELLVAVDDPTDDLVLQYKQAGPSVLSSVLGPTTYDNQGRRVVEGQRMVQAASDTLLGWTRVRVGEGLEADFYVRQMWDWKTSADLEAMDLGGLRVYARMCAWTLARAHCRSGPRKALAAYLGTGKAMDRALIEFAGTYADQNAADHQALLAAIRDGRVHASDQEADEAPVDMG